MSIRHVLAAMTLGAVLGAGGFALGSALTEPAPTPSPTPMPALEPVADVAARLVPSTVSIEAGDTLGSGVIYDPGGLILTAAHVVADSGEVTVRLAAGDRLEGEVLGRDVARDIAVIRIDREDLPSAPLARGEVVEVGQLAIVVGSPFGLEDSVSVGVVSATGRILPAATNAAEVIQTDAAINPGNSGGALADRFGRVVGINVSVRRNAGRIGFAVPIDVAVDVADRIVAGEPLPPPAFLGVAGTDPLSGRGGALVETVEPGSPAAAAGVRVNDLVIEVDAEEVVSMDGLTRIIRAREPGDRVRLTILRDDEELELEAELTAAG